MKSIFCMNSLAHSYIHTFYNNKITFKTKEIINKFLKLKKTYMELILNFVYNPLYFKTKRCIVLFSPIFRRIQSYQAEINICLRMREMRKINARSYYTFV